MKKTVRLAGLLFLCVSGLSAQRVEISPLYGRFLISSSGLGSLQETAKDDHTKLTSGNGVGLRVTWNTRGYYGVEGSFTRIRPTFETTLRDETLKQNVVFTDKINADNGGLNLLLYFMPAGERFRPFVTAGVQTTRYGTADIGGIPVEGTRNFGANFGGGLKVKLFDHALIRMDVRQYMGGKPYDLTREGDMGSGGRLNMLEASLGFAITF